jgi:hypothetical protein
MIIWEDSLARDSAEGVSDFCRVLRSSNRAKILTQTYCLSGHVRCGELATPDPECQDVVRGMYLLDALVGLFGPSRRHRYGPKYLAYCSLGQLVTRKSLAQEIRLLSPRQTFRR